MTDPFDIHEIEYSKDSPAHLHCDKTSCVPYDDWVGILRAFTPVFGNAVQLDSKHYMSAI